MPRNMRAIVLAAAVIGLREDQDMKNFCEYLRLYWAYLSTGFGWAKALLGAIVWLAGMFAPLAAKNSRSGQFADLARGPVDAGLGNPWLRHCALRIVEALPRPDIRARRLTMKMSSGGSPSIADWTAF